METGGSFSRGFQGILTEVSRILFEVFGVDGANDARVLNEGQQLTGCGGSAESVIVDCKTSLDTNLFAIVVSPSAITAPPRKDCS